MENPGVRFTPDELHAIALEYQSKQKSLQDDSEAAVVDWRFADGQMMSPRPLFDQVDKFFEYMHGWEVVPPRHWLTAGDDLSLAVKHGIDSEGRLRILQEGRSSTKTYFIYQNAWIDEVSLDDGAIWRLSRYVLNRSNGQIATWYEAREGAEISCQQEHVEWTEGRVSKSVVHTWLLSSDKLVESEFSEVYHYTYGSDGLLRKCVREGFRAGKPWSSQVIFSRPIRGDLARELREIEEFLVIHLPKALNEHSGAAPIYAAFLVYCGEDITSGWPGHLIAAPDAFRKKYAGPTAPQAQDFRIWDPDEIESEANCQRVELCERSAEHELQERASRIP